RFVLTDWRKTMASCGGTIRPISPSTYHSLMSLEAIPSLEQEATISRSAEKHYLITLLATLVVLLCISNSRLEAQSTFGSVRGIVQDSTGAAIPDAQITLHSIDENTDRTVSADAT